MAIDRKRDLDVVLEHVKEHLKTMQYGTVTLVVQDNVVIQIERNEKVRLK